MDGLGPIGIDVRENNRGPDDDVDGGSMPVSMSFGSAIAKYRQPEPQESFGGDQPGPGSTTRWMGPSVGQITGNSRQRIEMAIKAAKAVYGNDTVMVRLAVSQAILESGANLNSGLAVQGNNFFGIKGNGNAGTINFDTSEVFNGQTTRINAGFAKNDTPEASFMQHHDLMNRPRYAAVLAAAAAGDFEGAARAVKQSGYATDPAYAAKLVEINRRLVEPLLNGVSEQTIAASDAAKADRGSLRAATPPASPTTSLALNGAGLPAPAIKVHSGAAAPVANTNLAKNTVPSIAKPKLSSLDTPLPLTPKPNLVG